jgi:hypothetical protein
MTEENIDRNDVMVEKHYMEPNTIFIKKEGITTTIPLCLARRPSLNDDNYFIGIKYAVNDIEIINENEVDRCVNGLLYAVSDVKEYNIKSFVDDLKRIDFTNQDDELKPYFDKLLKYYHDSTRYNNSTEYSLYRMFQKHRKLVYSVLIKQAIITNCNLIFNSLSSENKKDLMAKLYEQDQNKIFDHVKALANPGCNNIVDEQNNGIKSLENAAMIDCINIYRFNEFNKDEKRHLCGICTLPQKCKKIHPMYKENIKNYDAITDGVQISDYEGLSDEFLVSNCKDYDKPFSKNLKKEYSKKR